MVGNDAKSTWREVPFSEACHINPSYKIMENEVASFIDMASLHADSPKVKKIELKKYNKHSGSKFRNGDVLFARITPCTENGKTGLVQNLETKNGFGSTEFIVLSPIPDRMDSTYLYYLVKDTRVRSKAIARMVGSTGRQRVPNEFFKEELTVLLPPIQYQRKIAAILTSVDDAIEKTTAIIKQTEKVKKGLMQQLLTKGIGHTEFKETEIGEIPVGWEAKRVDELVTFWGGSQPPRIALGKQEGLHEGIALGKQEAQILIAKNLLSLGMDLNQVAQMTGLEIGAVKKLRETH